MPTRVGRISAFSTLFAAIGCRGGTGTGVVGILGSGAGG